MRWKNQKRVISFERVVVFAVLLRPTIVKVITIAISIASLRSWFFPYLWRFSRKILMSLFFFYSRWLIILLCSAFITANIISVTDLFSNNSKWDVRLYDWQTLFDPKFCKFISDDLVNDVLSLWQTDNTFLKFWGYKRRIHDYLKFLYVFCPRTFWNMLTDSVQHRIL